MYMYIYLYTHSMFNLNYMSVSILIKLLQGEEEECNQEDTHGKSLSISDVLLHLGSGYSVCSIIIKSII